MTAEQWLADLEAKSTKAAQARKLENVCGWWDIAEFREATTPSTVLRLVGMVRIMADNIPGVVRPCAGCSRKCFLGDITKCEGDADAECWIAAAYTVTEERHD